MQHHLYKMVYEEPRQKKTGIIQRKNLLVPEAVDHPLHPRQFHQRKYPHQTLHLRRVQVISHRNQQLMEMLRVHHLLKYHQHHHQSHSEEFQGFRVYLVFLVLFQELKMGIDHLLTPTLRFDYHLELVQEEKRK